MGTYLHTHIITSFSTGNNLNQAKSFVADPELFTVEKEEDEEEHYIWTLKPGILKDHLYDLLKVYYNDFYCHDKYYFEQNCIPVLDFLATKPTETEIWNHLKKITTNAFCISNSYYRGADTIMLSYEGKVMFEEIENHLNFFNHLIRKGYSDNPLGGCLIVDIS